ncbi:MAG: type II toxin-antitoxin system VapC family toxin [Cyclonatronaceae bacterium]
MLDTDICIFILRKKQEQVFERLRATGPGDVAISSVTLAELMYGVQKSSFPEQNLQALIRFLAPIDVLPFDDHAAFWYGNVRHSLQSKGLPIGPYDMMIAAHALASGYTLVTNNTREFHRVQDLKVENWV